MRSASRQAFDWRHFLAAIGPGLAVMLADTESGSVITVAQSGARWGYRLLLLQFVLIVPLYLVQELACRLALGTGKGYVELIRLRFGRNISALAVLVLATSCVGTLVTEMSGLAGIGQLFGVPVWQTAVVLIVAVLAMVLTGSYRTVERMVIGLGLFELAFIGVAWHAGPHPDAIVAQLADLPLADRDYLYLVAANLGTSVMPWAIVYQQSALMDKGLGIEHLRIARFDVLLGAIICQAVTAAVLVASAASFSAQSPVHLESVAQVASAFTAVLGPDYGRLVFAAGVGGGSLVAMIVVCLTGAWATGELTGARHSLEHHPFEAPWFYATLAVMLIAGGALVVGGINVVRLSIGIGVVNAILLPVVLGLLYLLARRELRGSLRIEGAYAAVLAIVFFITAATGLYAGLVGAFG